MYHYDFSIVIRLRVRECGRELGVFIFLLAVFMFVTFQLAQTQVAEAFSDLGLETNQEIGPQEREFAGNFVSAAGQGAVSSYIALRDGILGFPKFVESIIDPRIATAGGEDLYGEPKEQPRLGVVILAHPTGVTEWDGKGRVGQLLLAGRRPVLPRAGDRRCHGRGAGVHRIGTRAGRRSRRRSGATARPGDDSVGYAHGPAPRRVGAICEQAADVRGVHGVRGRDRTAHGSEQASRGVSSLPSRGSPRFHLHDAVVVGDMGKPRCGDGFPAPGARPAPRAVGSLGPSLVGLSPRPLARRADEQSSGNSACCRDRSGVRVPAPGWTRCASSQPSS